MRSIAETSCAPRPVRDSPPRRRVSIGGIRTERTAPEVMIRAAVRPLVIADASGIQFKNGGPECAVERAFRLITEGKDVLDALIAGVNIPELDPEETGIGYGALPNADGVVQLDASCMHGPKRRAGGVAAIEGVRTPSLVAQAVMDQTDHHLLAGKGAQDFARALGFTDRGRPQHGAIAQAVARVASPDGSRALARPVEARHPREGQAREGSGRSRAVRACRDATSVAARWMPAGRW